MLQEVARMLTKLTAVTVGTVRCGKCFISSRVARAESLKEGRLSLREEQAPCSVFISLARLVCIFARAV